MLKKTMLLAFLACMSIASSCFATTWVKIGTATEWWYSPEEEKKFMDSTSREYYYDADDIIINKDLKLAIYTEAKLDRGTSIESLTNEFKVRRKKIDLSHVSVNGNRRFDVVTIAEGYYDPKTDKITETHNYWKTMGNMMVAAFDAEEQKGRYYLGNVLYREFFSMLDMPNLYRNSTVTPKGLGLAWINSTSEFGVFYDPKSVKVKGDSVNAKIYVWIPKINRIQFMNGKFNYTKQTFHPTSFKFIRISDGWVLQSYQQGLIPGILGAQLHTFTFDEEEPITIASKFFKSKLAQ